MQLLWDLGLSHGKAGPADQMHVLQLHQLGGAVCVVLVEEEGEGGGGVV